MAEKKKLTSPKTKRHNSAVVKELLVRADERGSTPGEAVFCFFVVQFFYSVREFLSSLSS